MVIWYTTPQLSTELMVATKCKISKTDWYQQHNNIKTELSFVKKKFPNQNIIFGSFAFLVCMCKFDLLAVIQKVFCGKWDYCNHGRRRRSTKAFTKGSINESAWGEQFLWWEKNIINNFGHTITKIRLLNGFDRFFYRFINLLFYYDTASSIASCHTTLHKIFPKIYRFTTLNIFLEMTVLTELKWMKIKICTVLRGCIIFLSRHVAWWNL